MKEKIKVSMPIIVEGRYDKATLSGFVDAVILTTGGFSIFNNKEKQALIRRIADNGIIVLTDSDGGGTQIRKFLSGIIAPEKIHHLYVPKIEGKEKRKAHHSAAGLLGVEGMEREVLERLLVPFSDNAAEKRGTREITKLDFFLDGLSGAENSSEKRAALALRCGLPDDMSAKALLEAMNLLYGYEEYKNILSKINE